MFQKKKKGSVIDIITSPLKCNRYYSFIKGKNIGIINIQDCLRSHISSKKTQMCQRNYSIY